MLTQVTSAGVLATPAPRPRARKPALRHHLAMLWHGECLDSRRLTQTLDNMHESDASASPVSSVVHRNIEALMASRRDADRQKSAQERVSEAVTAFAGSMWFVYVNAALFGGWLIWNLGWLPGVRAFDQGLAGLAIFASIEAMFLSTFVLINQKRMQAHELRRSELDLQISLLAEHEVTQLAELLEAVARKVGVQDEELPDIEETKQHVEPTLVLEAIHEQEAHAARQ